MLGCQPDKNGGLKIVPRRDEGKTNVTKTNICSDIFKRGVLSKFAFYLSCVHFRKKDLNKKFVSKLMCFFYDSLFFYQFGCFAGNRFIVGNAEVLQFVSLELHLFDIGFSFIFFFSLELLRIILLC